ncbi:MAG: hypothetical protein ACKVU1_12630 [bacterium]
MTKRSGFPFSSHARLAMSALLALAALGGGACLRSEVTDLSLLHVFYTASAVGYIEPCG